MSGLDIVLSQEQLFFPLPFSNATIENVVQVKNLLKAIPQNPNANVISFKVMSAVRHRYSVRPAVGFIGAGQAVTIYFSLDPEAIRHHPDPTARTLPDETTQDAIYIDLAVVPASATSCLARWNGSKSDNAERKEVQDDASSFWKSRGAVKAGFSDSAARKKLQCVFAARDSVPDSLVMCMKADRREDGKAAPPLCRPVATPSSRPPTTSATDPRNTAPPASLPRRVSPAGTPQSSTPTPPRQEARNRAAQAEKIVPKDGAAEVPVWTAIMQYKLPYAVVAVLAVAALLCGLYEKNTFFTWLLAGR